MAAMRSMPVALLALALGCTSCTTRSVSDVTTHPEGETYTTFDLQNRNLDVLFVIDTSASMVDEQAALTANFDDFMTVLRGIAGGLPSVHIGVVTTDVGIAPYSSAAASCQGDGDDGVLQNGGGACSVSGRFLVDEPRPDGTRSVNYSGTLEEAFGCIADVGAGGCGLEQHLEATRRALIDKREAENAGFLRDDAYLAVIIVSDEDDCSAADTQVFDTAQTDDADPLGTFGNFRCVEFGVTCAEGNVQRGVAATYTDCVPRTDSFLRDPRDFVDAILALKPSRDLVLVAGMTGNPDPYRIELVSGRSELADSCSRFDPETSTTSDAKPAPRMRWFLDQFGPDNTTSASICDDPFDTVLSGIAEKLADRFRPCLRGDVDLTDLSPDEGLQPDCQISDARFPDTDQQTETVIPRCEMSAESVPVTTTLPCWWVELDPASCPSTDTGLELHVERGGDTPPVGTQLVARCVAAP
jgi:hypothetical protein